MTCVKKMLIAIVLTLVLVGLAVGGFFFWRSKQGGGTKPAGKGKASEPTPATPELAEMQLTLWRKKLFLLLSRQQMLDEKTWKTADEDFNQKMRAHRASLLLEDGNAPTPEAHIQFIEGWIAYFTSWVQNIDPTAVARFTTEIATEAPKEIAAARRAAAEAAKKPKTTPVDAAKSGAVAVVAEAGTTTPVDAN